VTSRYCGVTGRCQHTNAAQSASMLIRRDNSAAEALVSNQGRTFLLHYSFLYALLLSRPIKQALTVLKSLSIDGSSL
jgi:hypothetical protein